MFTTMLKKLSFGERFVAASFFYIGIGLILLAFLPVENGIKAQSGSTCDAGENPCPSGYVCCEGQCVPKGEIE
jgi:hypothetical protein